MALESFYGGKQGISPVIKKSFWFVDDNFIDTNGSIIYNDFLNYVIYVAKQWCSSHNISGGNFSDPSSTNNLTLNNIAKNWFLSSNTNANITGLQEELDKINEHIMDVQFEKGDAYTDVWYSEYCIIDSPYKNFEDNGKLFRRTLNSRNENNNARNAEYIGTLRGPTGQDPTMNIISLDNLQYNFNNLVDKSDPSLHYSEDNNGTLEKRTFNLQNGGLHNEDNDNIYYSWYQLEDFERNKSEIHLGFSIPIPRFLVDSTTTVEWSQAASVQTIQDSKNPLKTHFKFNLPRGIKGTSVDNIQLKKVKDFKNLRLLLDFLKDENLKLLNDDNTFNQDFFFSTESSDEENNNINNMENEEYFKNYFLHYFNETVNINAVTGEATINEEENWQEYMTAETNNWNEKSCWFYFLDKIVGKNSLTYKKIEDILTQNSAFGEPVQTEESDEETEESDEETEELTEETGEVGKRRILTDETSNSVFLMNNIIEDIKELPILVYDAIFYNLGENSTKGVYTFFLCEYDNIQNISFDENTGNIVISYYYDSPEIFYNAIPLITGIEYDEDEITFIFNNTREYSVKFNYVDQLLLKDGVFSYTTQLNEIPKKLNGLDPIRTYKVVKRDNQIIVESSLLNPSEDSEELESMVLGEMFDFSFEGVLTNNIPIEDASNKDGNDWADYLNENEDYENYNNGIWVGTPNLGGEGNWYVHLQDGTWAYIGRGSDSWPRFYLRTDIIDDKNDLEDFDSLKRKTNQSDTTETNLSFPMKTIIFGKVKIPLASNFNPLYDCIPREVDD